MGIALTVVNLHPKWTLSYLSISNPNIIIIFNKQHWQQNIVTEKMMTTITPLQIQSSLQNQNVSLSLSYSHTLLPFKQRVNVFYTDTGIGGARSVSVTCSISKIHSYGTLDYERKPNLKWNAIYKRISMMENPELGSASVLNQWENEGRNLTKWELCRVVKELRKYRKHDRALQVCTYIVSVKIGFYTIT
jgi:hypothetical protein